MGSSQRESLFAQIDYWSLSIRVWDGGRPLIDIYQNLIHEILHWCGQDAHIKMLKDNDNHDELDLLATVLTDVLVRNGWLVLESDGDAEEKTETKATETWPIVTKPDQFVLTHVDIAQLRLLAIAGVQDEALISKESRETLIEHGLAQRNPTTGKTFITLSGTDYLLSLDTKGKRSGTPPLKRGA